MTFADTLIGTGFLVLYPVVPCGWFALFTVDNPRLRGALIPPVVAVTLIEVTMWAFAFWSWVNK